jgi:hypothetical protein
MARAWFKGLGAASFFGDLAYDWVAREEHCLGALERVVDSECEAAATASPGIEASGSSSEAPVGGWRPERGGESASQRSGSFAKKGPRPGSRRGPQKDRHRVG